MSSLLMLPVFQLDDSRILRGKETCLGHLRRTRELVTLFVEAVLHLWTVPGRRDQGPACKLIRLVHELFMRLGCPIARERVWMGAIISDCIDNKRVKHAHASYRLRGYENGI